MAPPEFRERVAKSVRIAAQHYEPSDNGFSGQGCLG